MESRNRRHWPALVGLLFTALATLPAQAELMTTLTNGQTSVHDSDTDLRWLSLSYTLNDNRDEVAEKLTEGGELAGWRFPTVAEVEGMITHAFPGMTATSEQVIAFSALFGHSDTDLNSGYRNQFSSYYVQGTYRNAQGAELIAGATHMEGPYTSANVYLGNSYSAQNSGIWLVADSDFGDTGGHGDPGDSGGEGVAPVSGPLGLSLLGLGLVGLSRRRRGDP